MRLTPLILSLTLLLAACATPQEQCINRATNDLRVVEGLIARLEADIARGYRLARVPVTATRWVRCGPRFPPPQPPRRPGAHRPPPPPIGPQMCLREVTHIVTRPEPFDIAEARVQLRQLKAKRRELERSAASAVAACKAQYPEP